jgi:hypothetical protein
MALISKETAHRIWMAHREIEVATTLLSDIKAALSAGEDPTPIDAFGRRRNYQLGVPSGDNSHRLFEISPSLAVLVIEAHVADKKRDLESACAIAKLNLVMNGEEMAECPSK